MPNAGGQTISQEAALPWRAYRNGDLAVPGVDPQRPHGLKYRLVYVNEGERLVGYDNERGKGDHKHIGEKEQVYVFQSVDQLLEDFWNDVKRCEDD